MTVQPYGFIIVIITIPILHMRKLRPRWRDVSYDPQRDGGAGIWTHVFCRALTPMQALILFTNLRGEHFSDLMWRPLEQLAFLWLGSKSIPFTLGWEAEDLPYTRTVTTCPFAEFPELCPFWAPGPRYCREVGLVSSDVVRGSLGQFLIFRQFSSDVLPSTFTQGLNVTGEGAFGDT